MRSSGKIITLDENVT